VFLIPPSRTPPTENRNVTHSSSPINPSQAVERIREIIVGRQFERLEQRVARLEAIEPQGPRQTSVSWESRLQTSEARLEAVQHSLQRLADGTREEIQGQTLRQQEEIQRLAAQIQQVAAMKSAEAREQSAVRELEGRLGAWLTSWQGGLNSHLNERDNRLADQLRGEVASLWESIETQITRLESRATDREWIEERFARIAAAARALAESASPTSHGPASSTFR
jgi:hemerythrin-like domain-containing protein